MESRFGEVTAVAQRLSFPYNNSWPARQPLPRVLLIGMPCGLLHPLAGLGVNLGFEDVRGLLACVDTMGGDLVPDGFTKFARQRLLKSQVMLGIMSGLQTLYGQSDP